jgi:hypothetical protein
MRELLQQNYIIICSWMTLIAALAVGTLLARGTQIQQLAIGLLCASVALALALAIFETIRWGATHNHDEEYDSLPRVG